MIYAHFHNDWAQRTPGNSHKWGIGIKFTQTLTDFIPYMAKSKLSDVAFLSLMVYNVVTA